MYFLETQTPFYHSCTGIYPHFFCLSNQSISSSVSVGFFSFQVGQIKSRYLWISKDSVYSDLVLLRAFYSVLLISSSWYKQHSDHLHQSTYASPVLELYIFFFSLRVRVSSISCSCFLSFFYPDLLLFSLTFKGSSIFIYQSRCMINW